MKLVILLALSLTLFSCGKDEKSSPAPAPTVTQNQGQQGTRPLRDQGNHNRNQDRGRDQRDRGRVGNFYLGRGFQALYNCTLSLEHYNGNRSHSNFIFAYKRKKRSVVVRKILLTNGMRYVSYDKSYRVDVNRRTRIDSRSFDLEYSGNRPLRISLDLNREGKRFFWRIPRISTSRSRNFSTPTSCERI